MTMTMPMAAAALFAVAVTVAAAALFAVAVPMAAAALFAVIMSVAVMAASAGGGLLNVVGQDAGDQTFDGFVGRAAIAGIELNAGLLERTHGTAADAAANNTVNGVFNEQINHGAVTVSSVLHQFGGNDRARFDFIEFEGGRHAEMQRDDVVFICNGDFHE